LFWVLLKRFCFGEEVTCWCVDVDAQVVAILRRLPENFGGLAEKVDTSEEAVDALTER
jgi:hypothetical protein